MAKYIILLDPLEKLSVKKDGSLLIAHTLKSMGLEVYLLFVKDLFFSTNEQIELALYSFDSALEEDSFYIRRFTLLDKKILPIESHDYLFFRLDPPFDESYLKTLWVLDGLKARGIKFINDPSAILKHNEKMVAFQSSHIPTLVSDNIDHVSDVLSWPHFSNADYFVIKPLNLYQGLGVRKIPRSSLKSEVEKWREEFQSHYVLQPFLECVRDGEIRSLFFDGQLIASILKIPREGTFLANISQGATYSLCDLPHSLKKKAAEMAFELAREGGRLVAFDILGGEINEANLTCPGLLVEISNALSKNVVELIAQKLFSERELLS